MRYVVLIRGINVGGRRPLPMAALRACVTAGGGSDPATYLQSGNAVCAAAAGRGAGLAVAIAEAVATRVGEAVPVLVRDARQWAAIVAACPWTTQPKGELHVTLLVRRPAAAAVRRLAEVAALPHRCLVVDGNVYLHCPGGYGDTKLHNAAIEAILGGPATTRNWRTVLALLDLLKRA